MDNVAIKKSIFRSQHCQRNWDLEKEMPQDDLDTLMIAATQCPSKQNIAFYKLHFVTNRDLIERIHSHTKGFVVKRGRHLALAEERGEAHRESEYTTNAQVLANLLIVFEEYLDTSKMKDATRSAEVEAVAAGKVTQSALRIVEKDRMMSIGVAAGYLNLTASIMGYSTGCCTCFVVDEVQKEMKIKGRPLLLMGIGFSDPTRNRRIHHIEDFIFPTHSKQPIPVEWVT
jgi:nitroreductase